MTERPKCKGCGKSIIFAKMSDGTLVPLDPQPAVYKVTWPMKDVLMAERAQILPATDDLAVSHAYLVSHFSTCPNADQFSGHNKGRGHA